MGGFALSAVQIVCLATIILAVTCLVVLDRPRSTAWAARRITSKLPFTLTLDAETRLRRRAVRDVRGVPITIGVTAGTLFVATTVDAGAAAVPVIVAVTAFAVVVHLVAPFQYSAELVLQPVPAVPVRSRVARSRVVHVRDYVRGFDLAAARVTAASAVLVMATDLVASLGAGVTSSALPSVMVGVVVLLAAVGVELGAAYTVRRGRPAGSTHALMSDDAVTSYALRTAYLSLAAIGCFGVLVAPIVSEPTGALPWPGLRLTLVSLATFGWLVCSSTQELDWSTRHFLVRLWGLPRRLPAPVLVPARPGNPYRGGLS